MPKETPGDFPPAAETGSPIEHSQRPEVAAYCLKAVVESADDAIITKTLQGVITSWNPGARRIFGYTAEEVIGKPVTVLIPEDHLDEEPPTRPKNESTRPRGRRSPPSSARTGSTACACSSWTTSRIRARCSGQA